MDGPYHITKRGPKGEPQEIRCITHPDCKWVMNSTSWKSDQDPIFVAQFAQHLRDKQTKDPQAFGHLRRARR